MGREFNGLIFIIFFCVNLGYRLNFIWVSGGNNFLCFNVEFVWVSGFYILVRGGIFFKRIGKLCGLNWLNFWNLEVI